jgi:hypothetical protein
VIVLCSICKRHEVDAQSPHTWRRMTGWARKGQNGGSDVAAREWLGAAFACDVCVRRLQQGVSPLQEELV